MQLRPYQLEAVESHIPEQADRRVAAGTRSLWPQWQAAQPDLPRRPQWLFDLPLAIDVTAGVPDGPPKQFVWRRVRRVIVRASGPERIASSMIVRAAWATGEPSRAATSSSNGGSLGAGRATAGW